MEVEVEVEAQAVKVDIHPTPDSAGKVEEDKAEKPFFHADLYDFYGTTSPDESSDESTDYETDTALSCDFRPGMLKPLPPPPETLKHDGFVYLSTVLPASGTYLHEVAIDDGAYVFLSLGKDSVDEWKEDVVWNEDTGEYIPDGKMQETKNAVESEFREKFKDVVQVKLYGKAPRLWGWISFRERFEAHMVQEKVKTIQETGLEVQYLKYSQWQERIEHCYEQRKTQ